MIKRCFDIVVATLLLLLFSPVMLVVAVLIYKRIGRPVLFRQERPGLGSRPFRMVKFRTMKNAIDGRGQLLADAERTTPLGNRLRAMSLDELPELWNVLKGDMSLVGPRPLLMAYLPLYTSQQARRHEARPGITGWAQVNGRNALSWEQKFALDIWYIENRSFLLDLKILLLTVRKVLNRDGINGVGEATVAPFRGTPEDDR